MPLNKRMRSYACRFPQARYDHKVTAFRVSFYSCLQDAIGRPNTLFSKSRRDSGLPSTNIIRAFGLALPIQVVGREGKKENIVFLENLIKLVLI